MPIASKETVDNIVLASYNAQRDSDWATRSPRERAKVLYRWATLIEQNQAYLACLEAIGSSRPMHEVLAWDIPYIIDTARFLLNLLISAVVTLGPLNLIGWGWLFESLTGLLVRLHHGTFL